MKIRGLLLGICLTCQVCCSNSVRALESTPSLYLGVENYGSVSDKNSFYHQFQVGNEIKKYQILSDETYSLENQLAAGYVYDITVENNMITHVEEIHPIEEGWVQHITDSYIIVGDADLSLSPDCYTAIVHDSAGKVTATEKEIQVGTTVKVYGNPATVIYEDFVASPTYFSVQGTPGERTLKNFLATAMMPVGTTLYIYGGHWDWQDKGTSNLGTTIGLSPKVTDFFQGQDSNFSYINRSSYSNSYFPHQNYNQYYYAGMDCSGYVGWVMYNTLHRDSGGAGYVSSSTTQAQSFAENGLGTFSRSLSEGFQVGDIFSMRGHIWIYLGGCSDGSFVILHSTPSPSITGAEGGGVQLTGVGNSPECEAAQLASHYMETYFPQWGQRYDTVYKSYSSYTAMDTSSTGNFSWHLSTEGLFDLDGYRNLTAEEILADLFSNPIINKDATRGDSIFYIWQALSTPDSTIDIPFSDVPSTLTEAVAWAYENGITSGTGDDTFSPDLNVTRGQFVCYLWALAEFPEIDTENPFLDVEDDAYYTKALLWAVANQITSGTSETTFSPNDTVTREQIVLFLRKFLDL